MEEVAAAARLVGSPKGVSDDAVVFDMCEMVVGSRCSLVAIMGS